MAVASLYGLKATIAAAITRNAAVLSLVPGYVMPVPLAGANHSYAVLSDGCVQEVVKILAITGNEALVVRAQGGTQASAFPKYADLTYEFTYAEANERIPYYGFPVLSATGAVTLAGNLVHVPDIRVTGADFTGSTIAVSPDALGCCKLPGLLVPAPNSSTTALDLQGDAPNTDTYPSTPNYAYSYTVVGGTAPYIIAMIVGAGPPGLVLSPAGIWAGRATLPGVYAFTLRVTDYWGATDTLADTITVVSALAQLGAAPDWVVNVPGYSYTYQAYGGAPPYTFAVISGAIPTGLTYSVNALLSGTPTVVGTYTFTTRVTDSIGSTADLTDTVVITAVIPPPAINEDLWFASTRVATGPGISDFRIVISRRVPAGEWLETSDYDDRYAPHSFRVLGQRLFGIRQTVRGSPIKSGGPVYSNNYGASWQLGTWSGNSTEPLSFDAIHITEGVAYTPANGPETNTGGNYREAYWKTSDGIAWTTVLPHRAVLYELSGVLLGDFVDPANMNYDINFVTGVRKLGRYGRIKIYFAKRFGNRTYIGVRVINQSGVSNGPGGAELEPGQDPGDGVPSDPSNPDPPPSQVPDNAAEFGGIFWNTSDVTGTANSNDPTSWKGGVVAPFQNMAVIGNRIVTAWNSEMASTYDPLNPPIYLPAPTNDVSYSDDGGLTFTPATFEAAYQPYMVEPRTLHFGGDGIYVVGYRPGPILNTSRATIYKSTLGAAFVRLTDIFTDNTGLLPISASFPYADYGGAITPVSKYIGAAYNGPVFEYPIVTTVNGGQIAAPLDITYYRLQI